MNRRHTPRPTRLITILCSTLLLAACTTLPSPTARTASIQRTANGVPHISAPDFETLAYGVAYAHAQDNVCQTAQQLLTARGERSRHFGAAATALLGRRVLSNSIIDFFIAAHMDDTVLASAWAQTSADAQAMARGYVAGYNRYLADNVNSLPVACKGQAWLLPMTLAHYFRLGELAMVQAGAAALADALLAAQAPAGSPVAAYPAHTLADATRAMQDIGLLDSPLGSNAWAFGRDSTRTPYGVLLGNPHFPWAGVNRFWMMHVSVPGKLDVMGASTGHTAIVNIGFNKNLAWSHTVSTGKRFTLHELALVPGDPTSYLIDGKPEKMRSKNIRISQLGADGQQQIKQQTVWASRWGPLLVLPRAGLNWTTARAYALQDANTGNARATDGWLGVNQAGSVREMLQPMQQLGMPWVNTLAADRYGDAMYADVSVVPDVDEAQVARCAPSAAAAGLRGPAGLIVLDGSKSDCNWRRDAASPVPGLIPLARLPVAIRSDWVHNSNDSFFYTHPAQTFDNISPLVGDAVLRRPRTRSGLIEVPELVARGPVTPQSALAKLFENHNLMARVVLPDLLAACSAGAPTPEATEGCAALRAWDRSNNLDARGAHLFREFWRVASVVPGVHRLAFDRSQPAATPAGLKMADAAVAGKVWDALTLAVKNVRAAGFALDAQLGSVQRPLITDEAIPMHGGDEIEGVLNNIGNQFAPGITAQGLRIDYGLSYLQAVTFDQRGPVAQGLLSYGQSTNPASPFAYDQLRLLSRKVVPVLPFHADDVARERVGAVLRLTRP